MKNIICKAKKDGICFGCDENNIENIENNYFDYYENQKQCETLKNIERG